MASELELYDAPSVPALPERLSLPEILETAKILAASGYFPTAKEAGQAAAKIMWGQDMGLTPMQAMTGIHVWVQSGTPTMQVSAKVITYLLKRHGFTWEFVQHDAEACEVEVYRHGKRLEPNVRFTKAQAAKAGLANKSVWQGYGEDMLWHRVAGRIADRFAPEIFDAAAIPVMTTEQAESTYPDPRDDLVKALHATYRERFPRQPEQSAEDYRDCRLEWSANILGRDWVDVKSWNGPEAPETLTRADVRTLLNALESTPALTREQAAPNSPGASTAGADHTQGSAGEQPGPPKAPGRSTPQAPPAEHHTEPSGGQAATRVGTGSGSEAGDGKPQPSGGPSAPTRKRRPTDPTGAPGVKEAAKQATAPMPQTYQYIPPSSWFWTLPTHAGRPILEHFGNVMKAAEAWLKPIAEQESDKPLAEWGELDNWPDAKVNVILAALEAEKAGAK